MSAPRIILTSLPSFCQKLPKLVEISQSSDKKNLHIFSEMRCILQDLVDLMDIFKVYLDWQVLMELCSANKCMLSVNYNVCIKGFMSIFCCLEIFCLVAGNFVFS